MCPSLVYKLNVFYNIINVLNNRSQCSRTRDIILAPTLSTTQLNCWQLEIRVCCVSRSKCSLKLSLAVFIFFLLTGDHTKCTERCFSPVLTFHAVIYIVPSVKVSPNASGFASSFSPISHLCVPLIMPVCPVPPTGWTPESAEEDQRTELHLNWRESRQSSWTKSCLKKIVRVFARVCA